MDTQSTFAKKVQIELQKKIVDIVKTDPSVLSDLTQLNSIEIPIDELLKDQKVIDIQSLRSYNDLKNANGQLVEMSYMIQGMFNPEMYAIAAIDTNFVQSGNEDAAIEVFKYHDTITSQALQNLVQEEFNENIVSALGDRSIYYAIPIPSQNKWTTKDNQNIQKEQEIKLEKKDLNNITYQGITISPLEDISQFGPQLQKIGLFNYESTKVGNQHSFPCILKYYNQEANKNPKLNQIVKVIGILSYVLPEPNEEQEAQGNNAEDEDLYESFDRTSFIYPERLIPRIHVLKSSTLTYENIYAQSLKYVSNVAIQSSVAQRQQLLEAFTKILGNDSLSAFYLLISVISSVNLNKDQKHYGNMFLNLLNTAQKLSSGAKISETLSEFLQSILVHSVHIPFTIKYLNTQFAHPQANSTGKISFGTLQLPKETKHYVICDETSLEQGQLDQKGISNMKNMVTFLQDLRIPFESEFFKGFVETDASGVILSDGKGLLHRDIQIKLEEDLQSGGQQGSQFAFDKIHDEDFLGQMRKYVLESKNMALTVQLDEEVANNIQIDFVEKRKQQAKENIIKKEEIINQESLERWIQLCRLNAASKLKQVATIEDYQEIKKYEENRIKRALKAYKKD